MVNLAILGNFNVYCHFNYILLLSKFHTATAFCDRPTNSTSMWINFCQYDHFGNFNNYIISPYSLDTINKLWSMWINFGQFGHFWEFQCLYYLPYSLDTMDNLRPMWINFGQYDHFGKFNIYIISIYKLWSMWINFGQFGHFWEFQCLLSF